MTHTYQIHLIQAQLKLSNFQSNFVRLVKAGDSLLFLNDSLFNLVEKDFNSITFKNLTQNITNYAIDEQLEARGLGESIRETVVSINYQKFVKLCQNASKVISW